MHIYIINRSPSHTAGHSSCSPLSTQAPSPWIYILSTGLRHIQPVIVAAAPSRPRHRHRAYILSTGLRHIQPVVVAAVPSRPRHRRRTVTRMKPCYIGYKSIVYSIRVSSIWVYSVCKYRTIYVLLNIHIYIYILYDALHICILTRWAETKSSWPVTLANTWTLILLCRTRLILTNTNYTITNSIIISIYNQFVTYYFYER